MSLRSASSRRAIAASAIVLVLAFACVLRRPVPHARPIAPSAALTAGERSAPAWADRFQGAKTGPSKEKVLREAASDGRPASVAFVAAVAASGDRLAKAAASALGDVANPSARSTLREAAASASVLAAANALRALGNVGDPADLPFLSRIAEERRGTRLWHESIRAMGKLHAEGALESWLRRATDEQERLSVLAAMKDAGRPESAAAIEAFLAAGSSDAERVFAKAALRRCR